MPKRKSKTNKVHRTTMRLTEQTMRKVTHVEHSTGWSQGASISFLCDAGVNALYENGVGVEAMKLVLNAAIEEYGARKSADSMVALQRAKLNEAKRALNALLADAEHLPDKAKLGGPVIVSPKRKAGRPRKNPQDTTEQNLKTPETHAETPGGAEGST